MGRSSGNRRRRGASHSPSNSFHPRSDPPPPSPHAIPTDPPLPDNQPPQRSFSSSSDLPPPRDRRFPDRGAGDRQRDGHHDRRSERGDQASHDRRYHEYYGDRRGAGGNGGSRHDQRWDGRGERDDQRSWDRSGNQRSWGEGGRGERDDQRWDRKEMNQRSWGDGGRGNQEDQAAAAAAAAWTTTRTNRDSEEGRASSRKSAEYPTVYFASRARELKEEGNRLFQSKDYLKAMEHYDFALKLTPPSHPDRAVFHSNKAACLMQSKPPLYQDAIRECNLALDANPGFGRALLRRARAYEAIGELRLALQDLESLLQADSSHSDAIEMAKRIRLSLLECEADCAAPEHLDVRGGRASRSTTAAAECDRHPPVSEFQEKPQSPHHQVASSAGDKEKPSDADALTAPDLTASSCTPTPQAPVQTSSRQMDATQAHHHASNATTENIQSHAMTHDGRLVEAVATPCPSVQSRSPQQTVNTKAEDEEMTPFRQTYDVDPFRRHSFPGSTVSPKTESSERVIHQDSVQGMNPAAPTTVYQMRPLKLIYDHDIRLAEMPVNCKFSDLRKIVKGTFPSARSVLIKYRDFEGDLVTITSTKELRLAEAAAAIDAAKKTHRIMSVPMEGSITYNGQHENYAVGLPVLDQLRLHVVEVPAEQEPYDKEDVVSMDIDESSLTADSKVRPEALDSNASVHESDGLKGKRDYDKWLLEFAELFRTHLGIESNRHVPLHELGLDLCAEALEEVAATEEAHKLFQQAVSNFRDAVALGYLHWGNVYMCTARKELPQDTDGEIDFCDRLQAAFDWAQGQYALAQEKFEQSLYVKPDFCDAMLSLGQKDFESAKSIWSLAIANQKDLDTWDSSPMLQLFRSAEQRLKKAAETLEQRKSEQHVGNSGDLPDAEHDVALKSQVNLLLGNVLYEHSQVEFRLGLPGWKDSLDVAVQRYEVAGAGSSDINVALQRHLSRSNIFLDADGENTAKGFPHGNYEASLNVEGTGIVYNMEDHPNERNLDTEITAGQKNASQHIINNGTFTTISKSKAMEVTAGDVLHSDESVGSCKNEESEVTRGCDGEVQLGFVSEGKTEIFYCNGSKDTYKSKEDYSPMTGANVEVDIDHGGGSNGKFLVNQAA